jgi:Xaa-Pro aminopeptidase
MERAYVDAGAEGVAYGSIVGSGLNGTVLHYVDNDGECRDGELMVIDSGAQFCGYACDVTRTLPVSGKFGKEQRELYGVVLRAQLAAIKAAKPGALMWEVDKAARDIIEKAGLGDAYIHGIGHQLGLEVHDVTPDGALKPGMVITIEPGVYLPERRVGIRIEDDILITKTGNVNLTSAIPKSIEDIEAAMKR